MNGLDGLVMVRSSPDHAYVRLHPMLSKPLSEVPILADTDCPGLISDPVMDIMPNNVAAENDTVLDTVLVLSLAVHVTV